MFEIKVSLEKQKEIIEEIESQDWSWIKEDYGKDDNFQRAVSRLKQEGIVTDDLCRIIESNIEIPVEREQKQELENMAKERQLKSFQEEIGEGNISLYHIGRLYDSEYIEDKMSVLTLSEDMAKKLRWVETTEYKMWDEQESFIKDNNTITYKNLERMNHLKIKNQEPLLKEMLQQYDGGIISEEEFWEKWNNILSSSIEAFEKQYQQERMLKVNGAMIDIKNFFQHMDIYEGKFSTEERESLEQLREEMQSIQKIDKYLLILKGEQDLEKYVDEREAFVDKWNIFAQNAWENYLKDEKHMLVHVTDGPIEGEYKDPYISTSLIVAGKHKGVYGRPNGYIIKPKKILLAGSEDAYIRNGVKDKYYALTSILVQLPQQIEEEQGKETSYSEIAVTDFEYEGVITFLPKEEVDYKKLQEMAKAQGNLPIKRLQGEKCILYEQEEKEIQNEIEQEKEKMGEIEKIQSIENTKEQEKQETESTTTMWENRLEFYYKKIERAPQNLRNKLIMLRANIMHAITRRLREREEKTQSPERE